MPLVSGVMHEQIVFDGSSAYGHYKVVDAIYAGRPARVLYSDNDAAQSGVALDNGEELLFDYNQRFRELLCGLQPRRVLVIGGGAFTLPAALQRELPEARLDIVELDPLLLAIAVRHFDFRPAAQTRIYLGDGIDYLRHATIRYDAIVVDVFVREQVSLVFQSALTAQRYRRLLTSGGLVAMNIIGDYHGRQESPALRRQVLAFRAAFRDVRIFPAAQHLSLWLAQNFIIIGQPSPREIPWMRTRPITTLLTLHV